MTVYELIEMLLQITNKEATVTIKHGCLIAGDRIVIDEEVDR